MDLLRHVRKSQAVQAFDVARVGSQFAQQQCKQAGLATAIGTDECDVLARLQGHVRPAQQQLAAPPESNIP